MTRPNYDCDTFPYWCSEEDYHNRDKRFGEFIEDGAAYRIDDPDTPRPWLNYLANHKFGSVVSNRGLGFTWYRSTLLRITRYEHPIDYLPRDFQDGREIIVADAATGASHNLLREAADLVCIHRPGSTTIQGKAAGLTFVFTLFVPLEDPCEVWTVELANPGPAARSLRVTLQQTWSFARFGIHTAEEGIPCISTPGKDFQVTSGPRGVYGHSADKDLPYEMWGLFQSPQANVARCIPVPAERPDGRRFVFHRGELESAVELRPGAAVRIQAVSGADVSRGAFESLRARSAEVDYADVQFALVGRQWKEWHDVISCRLPDPDLQNFLNVWFKNQLHLTFHFVRSGQNGYRDSLQDDWGYTLLDPVRARARLLEILSHQNPDGTAPRNFSAFDDGVHDARRYMDSPVWIPRTLADLVKETGEFALLDEAVPFLGGEPASVEEHIWRALDYLYSHRGPHGACLTGEGDWNDALEGISRQGDAESVWLTIALYDAMNVMAGLYEEAGRKDRAAALRARAAELKAAVNDKAWDGEWYVYGFTGSGRPIGSRTNREGKIHLNTQTWAVFSGLADRERARMAMDAVEEHLDTPLGPALLAPPYVHEADEVGRIARLEPGTFENGSIYQHAVAFMVAAELALGDAEAAYATLTNLLPTNPDNFDCRRTSEPYCTGNYYCGPGHPRFGQNFFTWFTGNAAWLLRLGFDGVLGVRAGYHGLELEPRVPASWKQYTVRRRCRGCDYTIEFVRAPEWERPRMTVDGAHVEGRVVPVQARKTCAVKFHF